MAAGATQIGLVQFAPSPQHLALDRATELRALAKGRIKTVLLLVNADPVTTAKAIEQVKPDVLQLHGSETPEWAGLLREKTGVEVWKVIGLRDAGTLERSAVWIGKVDRLLFDSPAAALPGGNGESFD